ADLAAGIVQQSVLHFPDFFGDKRIHSLAGHVAVTNTGAVPPFRTPAGKGHQPCTPLPGDAGNDRQARARRSCSVSVRGHRVRSERSPVMVSRRS
uniref:phthiocerol/phthiodiolone dimycocerosyl transferase family protein n=1 Tax=Nocardia brasiliensis TaxID=37326 RepID=UPI003D781625